MEGTHQCVYSLASKAVIILRPLLEPVANIIGPEPFQPTENADRYFEIVLRDATDLLNRAHMLVIEITNDLVNLVALIRQANPHRAAINARALVKQISHFHKLFDIIRDI